MRVQLTKLKDGAPIGVHLEHVQADEVVANGTRLYSGSLQIEVRETWQQIEQLRGPYGGRDLAAELAAKTNPARQQEAAHGMQTAQSHPIEQAAATTMPPQPIVAPAAPGEHPPAPIIGVQTAPVFVDPALWHKVAGEAKAAADQARANADAAAAAATNAQTQATDIATQMEAALRAQGVKWPSDAPAAAPAAGPAEPAKTKPAAKSKGKPAAKSKGKPATKAKTKAGKKTR